MSRAVMLSIRPEWVEKILSGEKTLEVRKSKPKLDVPFKCYIWQTNGGGVVGEFTCDYIERMRYPESGLVDVIDAKMSCLTAKEIFRYSGGNPLYGWHISDLKVYGKPKTLGDFTPDCKYLDSGECEGIKCVDCVYQFVDCNPDGTVNVVMCKKRMHRPPQSWCYVEELA